MVFGKNTVMAGSFPATLDLAGLDGSNGFRLDGMAPVDYAGRSVSAAGDFNGDGIDDLIVGAPLADRNGANSGSSYLVFGKNTTVAGNFPARIALASLSGSSGWRLDGAVAGDQSGSPVSGAGDINGDGFDDVIVGAPNAGPNGTISGSSFVVFGLRTPLFKDGFE